MRILGFSKKWGKLQQDEFTTFRYPRKDSDKGRDWHDGETLKIVYHPRQEHEYLGVALIISKEARQIMTITDDEAIADGFSDSVEMMLYLKPEHGYDQINKLTLKWIFRNNLIQ